MRAETQAAHSRATLADWLTRHKPVEVACVWKSDPDPLAPSTVMTRFGAVTQDELGWPVIVWDGPPIEYSSPTEATKAAQLRGERRLLLRHLVDLAEHLPAASGARLSGDASSGIYDLLSAVGGGC